MFHSQCRLAVYAGALALSGAAFAADSVSKPVTFTKDVAPIFQSKCEECHRPGTSAPMALRTYQEVRPWAKSIKQRVATRNMPPWHLDKTVGIQHFANDRSLSDDQINTIVRWVDAGSPMGDAKDLPAPRKWDDDTGWALAKQYGAPDVVIKSDDFTMPAHGQDVWFKPLTSVDITEPRWVRAVEMRPGSVKGRKIMHHILARLMQDESSFKASNPQMSLDSPGGGPGLLMEWAVGKNFDVYRPGTGKLLLPGAKIWWELHIHAVGEEIRDHAELGVYFYPKGETPKNRTYLTLFSGTGQGGSRLDIPPNTVVSNEAFTVLKAPARLENFQPHMHLRGKAMAIEAILPDGQRQMLSYVNNFNFNWMNNYIYTDDDAPVLPKGAIVHVTSWHDNTTANPNNPDPNQWVGYGDRTVDEMAHAWVNVTYISEEDYSAWAATHKRPARGGARASADNPNQ
jgi:hypothetical protein